MAVTLGSVPEPVSVTQISEPVVSSFTRTLTRPRIYSQPATEPREAPDAVGGTVEVNPVVSPTVKAVNIETEPAQTASGSVFKKTISGLTSSIADTFNTNEQTVKNVGLISLIGTGAGLLANGVKSLFDGTLKAKRAEKKAEKAEAKIQQQAAVLKAAYGQATGGAGVPAPGDSSGASAMGAGKFSEITGKAGDFVKKNWMWLVPVALILFGQKLLPGIFGKKKAVRRRRPARTKVVTRYRTRRAPARRRRR